MTVEADLWIGLVSRATDANGKPIVRYEIHKEDGSSLGSFVTPITSRLARVLLEQIGEEAPIRMEKGRRVVIEESGEIVEWDGAAWQPVAKIVEGWS